MNPNSYDIGTPDSLKTTFPPFLQPYLSLGQWNIILQSFRQAHENATCAACGGEWCCCFVTGFFCIFCFHAPIYLCIRESMLNDALRQANNFYFKGHSVFYSVNGIIYINMNALPPAVVPVVTNMPVMMVQPIHTQTQGPQIVYANNDPNAYPTAYASPYQTQAPVQVVPQYGAAVVAPPQQYGSAPPPQYGAAAPPPQYQSPPANQYDEVDAPGQYGVPASSPQVGQYVVTPDVQPGSQIQVTSPAGHTVLLNIPKDAVPGSVIQYTYN